jgi:hypothetical protein
MLRPRRCLDDESRFDSSWDVIYCRSWMLEVASQGRMMACVVLRAGGSREMHGKGGHVMSMKGSVHANTGVTRWLGIRVHLRLADTGRVCFPEQMCR